MSDAGEGLIDAQDDYQEKLAERERQQEQRARGPMLDPATERARKSLDLAKAELNRQAETTTHPVRKRPAPDRHPRGRTPHRPALIRLPGPTPRVPKIVASFLSREQEFQVLQSADARAAAARHGYEIEVLFAELNAVEQIQQLFRFIHLPVDQRPAAIVVETVTGEGLERVARNAAQAGIGWVLLNRKVAYLDELRANHPGLPLSP